MGRVESQPLDHRENPRGAKTKKHTQKNTNRRKEGKKEGRKEEIERPTSGLGTCSVLELGSDFGRLVSHS